METTTRRANSQTGSRLALLGGSPAREHHPPPYPVFSDRARERVDALLREGNSVGLSKANPVIREAEETLAAWHGVEHCLGTISGHGALHASLVGLEITGGDEVITTPYSWGASASCILHNGALPVFADVDPVTGLLSPAAIEPCLTPRSRAILVTHIFGQPADMTSITEVARKHGLAVIEDGSQAHGARHRGVRVGSLGTAAGFSAMGGKLLATTECGYMLTDDPDLYWKAVLSCQHAGGTEHPGRASDPGFPPELRDFIDSLNYTYRMSTINAVLIVEQLAKLDDENANRAANREALKRGLDGLSSVDFPEYPSADTPVFHMITMNYQPEAAGVNKSTYVMALQAEGVPVFSYMQQPLNRSPRLRVPPKGPRTMWASALETAPQDYQNLDLPGCDEKVDRSIEMTWNYINPAESEMQSIADAFVKVEDQLPALREYEAKLGTPSREQS